MRFGTSLSLDPLQKVSLAQHAERLGFESVWDGEHPLIPKHEHHDRHPVYEKDAAHFDPDWTLVDPFVSGAAIAASTTRLRVGTAVCLLPLRETLATARAATTLDVQSGGRFLLGVGAGWLEEEFRSCKQDFRSRGPRLAEQVKVLRCLWDEETPEFHGRFHDFGPSGFQPKPTRGRIPILMAGGGKHALQRAGELGDGWLGTATLLDQTREIVETLRAHRKEAGRTDDEFFDTTVMALPEQIDADVIAELESLDVNRVMLSITMSASGDEGLAERMTEIASRPWFQKEAPAS